MDRNTELEKIWRNSCWGRQWKIWHKGNKMKTFLSIDETKTQIPPTTIKPYDTAPLRQLNSAHITTISWWCTHELVFQEFTFQDIFPTFCSEKCLWKITACVFCGETYGVSSLSQTSLNFLPVALFWISFAHSRTFNLKMWKYPILTIHALLALLLVRNMRVHLGWQENKRGLFTKINSVWSMNYVHSKMYAI